MKAFTPALAALAIFAMLEMAGCGSNRQLQSISVSPQAIAPPTGQAQFTATGQFNASPMTVTPLPSSWFVEGPGIDPAGLDSYTLSTQPAIATCVVHGSTVTVIAYAPMDPNAPASGSMPHQVFTDLVTNHTTSSEGGFVAVTAQMNCP